MYEASALFISSIFFVTYCQQRKLKKQVEEQQSTPKKKGSDPESDYSKEKGLFDTLYCCKEETNTNIYPDLYCDSSLTKKSDEQDWSIAEKQWKSRILFHHTLQGNVIMYYDIYKFAFVYYSDMQISYKWLNYCAMKYVRIFNCRDFFFDDSFLPETFENPFNQNKLKEEKEEVQKKEDKKKMMEIDFQSDVFLKRRETPNKIIKRPTKTDIVVEEKCVNNFRYMGKIANYSFLQIPMKEEKRAKETQYRDFKKKLKKKDKVQ